MAPSAPAGGGNIKVVVRVRPFNTREIDRGARCVVEMQNNQTILLPPSDHGKSNSKDHGKKVFAFDKSYWSFAKDDGNYAGQDSLFGDLGQPLLDNAFQGYNNCIFAYGQTGSGKSYSMMGYGKEIGIIPNICQDMFRRIDELQADKNLRCTVEVSYLEIYNERVRDLLNPANKGNLKVREHPSTGPYVEDLAKLAVSSFREIEHLMDEGNKARTVAATNMNETSSRSHAVFTLMLTQKRFDTETKMAMEKVAKISLVDLAGSERANSTGATGARLKEGAEINRSLSTLGRVIAALADLSTSTAGSGPGKKKKTGATAVPYRDSVLTWLLKDSLGGNSMTAMIAAISPADINYDETLSTLRYADSAKRIRNHAVINEDANARMIRELKEELALLRSQLGGKSGPGMGGTVAEGALGNGLIIGQEAEVYAEGTPLEKQFVSIKTPDGETKKVSKAEIAEQLHQSEKLLQDLNQTWEQKLAKTEEIQKEREQALEELGISIEKGFIGLSTPKKMPHLVNLSDDPLLAECLVYNLKPGSTTVGNMDSNADHQVNIRLNGTRILHDHCSFENDAVDGTVTVVPRPGASVMVNGQRITEAKQLHSGYRVILGDFHIFRFNHPLEARAERAERAEWTNTGGSRLRHSLTASQMQNWADSRAASPSSNTATPTHGSGMAGSISGNGPWNRSSLFQSPTPHERTHSRSTFSDDFTDRYMEEFPTPSPAPTVSRFARRDLDRGDAGGQDGQDAGRDRGMDWQLARREAAGAMLGTDQNYATWTDEDLNALFEDVRRIRAERASAETGSGTGSGRSDSGSETDSESDDGSEGGREEEGEDATVDGNGQESRKKKKVTESGLRDPKKRDQKDREKRDRREREQGKKGGIDFSESGSVDTGVTTPTEKMDKPDAIEPARADVDTEEKSAKTIDEVGASEESGPTDLADEDGTDTTGDESTGDKSSRMEEALLQLKLEMQQQMEKQKQEYEAQLLKADPRRRWQQQQQQQQNKDKDKEVAVDPNHVSQDGPHDSLVLPPEFDAEDILLVKKYSKRWRRRHVVKMAEDVLQKASLLKEAQILSQELDEGVVFQFTVVDVGHTVCSSYDMVLNGLTGDGGDDEALAEAAKPCIAVRLVDYHHQVVRLWSLAKLEERVRQMRHLRQYLDQPEYTRHLSLENPFREPEGMPAYSLIGEVDVPLRAVYESRVQDCVLDVVSPYTQQAMGMIRLSLEPSHVRAPPSLLKFNVVMQELVGFAEREGTDLHAQLFLLPDSLDADGDGGGDDNGGSYGGQSVTTTQMIRNFDEGAVRFESVHSMTIPARGPKSLSMRVAVFAKVTSMHLDKLLSWDDMQAEDCGRRVEDESNGSSIGQGAIAAVTNGQTSGQLVDRVSDQNGDMNHGREQDTAGPSGRLGEHEFYRSETHHILARMQILEMDEHGEYVAVEVLAHRSHSGPGSGPGPSPEPVSGGEDAGAFQLHQGLQRRIAIQVIHSSGDLLPWERLTNLRVGLVQLVDPNGHITDAESHGLKSGLSSSQKKHGRGLSSGGGGGGKGGGSTMDRRYEEQDEDGFVSLRLVTAPTFRENANGTRSVLFVGQWDSSLHHSLLLDRTTADRYRVQVTVCWDIHMDGLLVEGQAYERMDDPKVEAQGRMVTRGRRLSEPIRFSMPAQCQIQARNHTRSQSLLSSLWWSSTRVVHSVARVYSLTLRPAPVTRIQDLWRVQSWHEYVRGEENLTTWCPRGVSLVLAFWAARKKKLLRLEAGSYGRTMPLTPGEPLNMDGLLKMTETMSVGEKEEVRVEVPVFSDDDVLNDSPTEPREADASASDSTDLGVTASADAGATKVGRNVDTERVNTEKMDTPQTDKVDSILDSNLDSKNMKVDLNAETDPRENVTRRTLSLSKGVSSVGDPNTDSMTNSTDSRSAPTKNSTPSDLWTPHQKEILEKAIQLWSQYPDPIIRLLRPENTRPPPNGVVSACGQQHPSTLSLPLLPKIEPVVKNSQVARSGYLLFPNNDATRWVKRLVEVRRPFLYIYNAREGDQVALVNLQNARVDGHPGILGLLHGADTRHVYEQHKREQNSQDGDAEQPRPRRMSTLWVGRAQSARPVTERPSDQGGETDRTPSPSQTGATMHRPSSSLETTLRPWEGEASAQPGQTRMDLPVVQRLSERVQAGVFAIYAVDNTWLFAARNEAEKWAWMASMER